MNNKNNIASKTVYKKKIREIRLKKLEQRLKSNIIKRKNNKIK